MGGFCTYLSVVAYLVSGRFDDAHINKGGQSVLRLSYSASVLNSLVQALIETIIETDQILSTLWSCQSGPINTYFWFFQVKIRHQFSLDSRIGVSKEFKGKNFNTVRLGYMNTMVHDP